MAKQTPLTPGDPDIFAILREVRPFGRLTDDEIRLLLPILRAVEYAADDVVFSEGDAGTAALIVAEGELILERWGHRVASFAKGDLFGEIALIDDRPRTGSVIATRPSVLLTLEGRDLENPDAIPSAVALKIIKGFSRQMASYVREGADLFDTMDVLVIQDGGCAPGYNPVTAFVTEYLEKLDRRVFVAAEGFRSLVSNRTADYRCLIHDQERFNQLDHIPGVQWSQPLRGAAGAGFRSERFPEFKEREVQDQAVRNLLERQVKVLVGIGGNGTLAGTKALADSLPADVHVYFIPVTIDSDVFGTNCIGEHTGVEVGADKIRGYMADARTHKRCYIVEMMGAEGGFHALHSCLGAGADLAMLPASEHDPKKVAAALAQRRHAVIVVAEGYGKAERKAEGHTGNAAEFFRDQLLASGESFQMRLICEPFSRDIRGATPNNMDITLASRLAHKLADHLKAGESRLMPAVLGEREESIPLAEVRTDNSVQSGLAQLGNHLY